MYTETELDAKALRNSKGNRRREADYFDFETKRQWFPTQIQHALIRVT